MRDPGARWTIERGCMADYRALARFHYRAGDPAPGSRVWVCRRAPNGAARADPRAASPGEIVGVLVVSRPVLNGPWRDAAWPGRFSPLDRRLGARRVNRELRVISRVVIDPRARAMGLGSRLVRAYLRRPLTRRTEALAAMGAACPMFARAGMRRVPWREPRRNRALRRALADAGVQAWALAAPWALPTRARRALAPALRSWARQSRATRAIARERIETLMARAASALCPMAVFVHERGSAAPARPRRARRASPHACRN
ncbi:MAG: hypothetical protein AB7Q91_04110 [Phycisphaerales bacterium]